VGDPKHSPPKAQGGPEAGAAQNLRVSRLTTGHTPGGLALVLAPCAPQPSNLGRGAG
jgi:hypothetical protein